MRNLLLLFVLLLFASCGLSDDCIKSAGNVTTKTIVVTPFENIYVNPGIALVITQGDEYAVIVEAGDNFIDEIQVSQNGNTLTLKDQSGCNWVRDYGQTTVYITAPNLVEIYSNSERTISSNGVLTYPILRLYALEFYGGVGTGDFIIDIDNDQLVVQSSHVASFFINGQTDQLLLSFYNGNGRFEGENLLADDVIIFHRGTNDMIVSPVNALTGDIYSTGNLIVKTNPTIVEIIEHYTGNLIFD